MMKTIKNNRLLWIPLAIVAVIGIGYWISTQSQKEDNLIKIGAILPLSGDFSIYGEPAKNGIDLAIKDIINQTEDSITVIYEDSKGDGKTAVNSYIKLVSTDKVKFIIGDLLSSTTLSMAPQANKSEILLISPTASTSELNKFGKYSFSIYPSEVDEGYAAAKLAKSLGYLRIGIIYENAPSALGMADSFQKKFGAVEFNEKIESSEKDFKNLISKIKDKKFDAIYLITYPEPAKKIIKTMKEQNLKTNFISQSALYDPSFAYYIKDFVPTNKRFCLTGAYFNDERADTTSINFKNRYLNTFHMKPNMFAAQSYEATKIGYELFKNNENFKQKSDKFIYTGVSGTFSFDNSKKQGFAFYEIDKLGKINILK